MTSRPSLGWSDLAGAKVGLWGIGVEARSSLRRLTQLGATPVLVDDQPATVGGDLGEIVPTGRGGLELLASCEVVVKAPGISRYRPDVRQVADAGVPVAGGLGLWLFEADRDRVVCVTGTKGKSTTVSIAGHLADGLGRRAFVGGNLGVLPYDPAAPTDVDLWLVETSSYQATDLPVSPPIVAITSLSPDHLQWHGDVATYYRDKLSVASQPGADLTIASGTDRELRAREDALGPRRVFVSPPESSPGWAGALGLAGQHNLTNALIAQRCLIELGVEGADDGERLVEVARGFAGLDSRLQLVGHIGGVDFVDDSLSTNVLSTIAGLEVYADRPVALLAGGHDRRIDYEPLGRHLAARAAPTLLIALPTTGEAIAAAVVAHDPTSRVAVARISGDGDGESWLPAAVEVAHRWAEVRAGVVLLSPAAASFDHFRDYRHRGATFAASIAHLDQVADGPD